MSDAATTATAAANTIAAAQHDRLNQAFPPGSPRYDQGYRDALQSMAPALGALGVPSALIEAAIISALDAFTNNAC